MAKQVKVLFGVKTLGGPWHIVLDRGWCQSLYGEEREWREIVPIV